jgi:hypothetical protein
MCGVNWLESWRTLGSRNGIRPMVVMIMTQKSTWTTGQNGQNGLKAQIQAVTVEFRFAGCIRQGCWGWVVLGLFFCPTHTVLYA